MKEAIVQSTEEQLQAWQHRQRQLLQADNGILMTAYLPFQLRLDKPPSIISLQTVSIAFVVVVRSQGKKGHEKIVRNDTDGHAAVDKLRRSEMHVSTEQDKNKTSPTDRVSSVSNFIQLNENILLKIT